MTASAALNTKDVRPGDRRVPFSSQGQAPRVVQVCVQGSLGRKLQELDLCGLLTVARVAAVGKDAPALENAPAMIGKQSQHPVLVGAERGFLSRFRPQQDTEAYWVLKHPASLQQGPATGNHGGSESVSGTLGRA